MARLMVFLFHLMFIYNKPSWYIYITSMECKMIIDMLFIDNYILIGLMFS